MNPDTPQKEVPPSDIQIYDDDDLIVICDKKDTMSSKNFSSQNDS
jgi:hypothetical protein